MTSTADLAMIIRAQDQASGPLAKVHGALGGLGGMAVGAAAIGGAALVGLGAAAYQLGSAFDESYDKIRTTTGATGAALQGLQNDFRAVAAQVPADFGQISTAIAEVSRRTGTTGPELQGLATQFLNLARVTGQDMTTSIGLVTRVFGDWGIASQDQAGTMDMLLRASQATGIGVNDLSAKVVQFGAPLRAMGFTIEESAAMLGKWEKEGVNTELVLGSLRIAMGQFAKAGVPMREGLEDTFQKIQKLGPGAEATSLAMKTFGARAGPDMAAAILEGRFELGALLDQITNGSETIQSAADDTADAAEKWQVATNRMALALEPLGTAMFALAGVALEALLPAFEDLLAGAAPAIEELGSIVENMVDGDMTAALEQLMDLLGRTGEALGVKLGEWGAAFVQWVQDAGPPFLAAAADMGLRFLQWAGSQVGPLIETLATWAAAFVDWIAPQIPPMLAQLGALVTSFTDWMILTGFNQLVTTLDKWGQAFVDWIGPKLPGLIIEAVLFVHGLTRWMGETALKMIGAAAAHWGEGIVRGMVEGVGGLSSALGQAIRDAIGRINFRVGLLTFSGGNISIDVGGLRQQVANIPGFDLGGTVPGPRGAPMLAIVHGGETVVPPGAALASGGSGTTSVVIQNHINGPIYGFDDLEDVLVRATERAVTRGRLSSAVLV